MWRLNNWEGLSMGLAVGGVGLLLNPQEPSVPKQICYTINEIAHAGRIRADCLDLLTEHIEPFGAVIGMGRTEVQVLLPTSEIESKEVQALICNRTCCGSPSVLRLECHTEAGSGARVM